jgi:hypothetical protein
MNSVPARTETIQVTIGDLVFPPADIKAKAGGTVTWTTKTSPRIWRACAAGLSNRHCPAAVTLQLLNGAPDRPTAAFTGFKPKSGRAPRDHAHARSGDHPFRTLAGGVSPYWRGQDGAGRSACPHRRALWHPRACAPRTGAALVMPTVSIEAMNKHLAEISQCAGPGAIALLTLDGVHIDACQFLDEGQDSIELALQVRHVVLADLDPCQMRDAPHGRLIDGHGFSLCFGWGGYGTGALAQAMRGSGLNLVRNFRPTGQKCFT